MNIKLNSFPEHQFSTLDFYSTEDSFHQNFLRNVTKLKEDLLIKVLKSYLDRDVTGGDLSNIGYKYYSDTPNEEEIFYDNILLGRTEIGCFENNDENFSRNNFRVVCNFKPYNPITSTFPIV